MEYVITDQSLDQLAINTNERRIPFAVHPYEDKCSEKYVISPLSRVLRIGPLIQVTSFHI